MLGEASVRYDDLVQDNKMLEKSLLGGEHSIIYLNRKWSSTNRVSTTIRWHACVFVVHCQYRQS